MARQFGYILILILCLAQLQAQTVYKIDASKIKNTEIKTGYFNMGTSTDAQGRSVSVNNRYLSINGVPQIPVMGELQFSRMSKDRWADEILKMKAGGVNIIATYLFWNHHEEIEGQFDWSGNKDLRSFIKLCGELGVYAYPRIGPWSHGEARNGGTPDWILKKRYIVDRSADPVYQQYVEKYFAQIGLQLKGLMFKDGGPVIGIQLENEYWKGKAGEPYMMWLKQTAIKNGLDVPLYTVTGWGDSSVPAGEFIPLWGGYPDESWVPDIEKITNCGNYCFSNFRNDETIGNAQVKQTDSYINHSQVPYFTCEMGVGIFVSTHRRPVIGPLDGMGMIMSKIGSGGNLLGYYVYAGGSNPLGVYNTMEENKEETGYWCGLSPVSYDFQAAIRENGTLNSSYYEVKKLNYFLLEYGHLLAPMEPVFATGNKNDFQYALRIKNNSGFLFGINFCRNNQLPEKKDVRFSVKMKDQTVEFPSKPMNIADSSLFIWPLNMDLNGVTLKYATAQPIYGTLNDDIETWIFVQDTNTLPELCFDGTNISAISTKSGNISTKGKCYLVSDLKPGLDCIIDIQKKSGHRQRILILSKEEGLHAWILKNKSGKKEFFISRSDLYMHQNTLTVIDNQYNMQVKKLVAGKDTLFQDYNLHTQEQVIPCQLKPEGALQKADWLVSSVKKVNPGNLLYHKLFQKEFSAFNPAKIKWAKMIIAPESACRLRINENWCNQRIDPGKINTIDITGYITKGENTLLIDFPVEEGDKAFAARIIVEYFNSERLDFTTDSSWLTSELYYYPAVFGDKPVFPLSFTAPVKAGIRKEMSEASLPDFAEWTVNVPCNYMQGLNNLYIAMNYAGDRVSVRLNKHLIADNLNNNTDWMLNLKRDDSQMECKNLEIEINPWKETGKIYFDKMPSKSDEGKAFIRNIRFVPEYKVEVEIK